MTAETLKQEGEELIVRSQGYLKPPETWKRRYDLKQSGNPRAFSQEENGKIRLIFEWDEGELRGA